MKGGGDKEREMEGWSGDGGGGGGGGGNGEKSVGNRKGRKEGGEMLTQSTFISTSSHIARLRQGRGKLHL